MVFVKSFSHYISRYLAILTLLLATFNTSCGWISKNWGEKGPSAKQVKLDTGTLPSPLLILTGTNEESLKILQTWEDSIQDAFGMVRGKTPNTLTLKEIETLIRVGLIDLGPNAPTVKIQLFSALKLLGFGEAITRQDVGNLFSWLRQNRVRLRTFNQALLQIGMSPDQILKQASVLKASEAEDILMLISSFTDRLGEASIPTSQLESLIQPWIPSEYQHAKTALQSGIDLMVSLSASLCGDRVEKEFWNGKKLGSCLKDFVVHFRSAYPYIEFATGHFNFTTDRQKLLDVRGLLSLKIDQWISNHHHPLFELNKIKVFSEKLDLPLPKNFNKLGEWLHTLNPINPVGYYHPQFGVDLAALFENWLMIFLKASSSETSCTQLDWKNCPYTGNYSLLEALYQPRYASFIQKKNLELVHTVSLYDALGQFLVEKLDQDHDGVLGDEIRELLDLLLKFVDSYQYLDNIVSRVLEKPIDEYSLEDSVKALKTRGLSELAALAAEVFPDRTGGQNRTIRQRLAALFNPSDKQMSYTLDATGITSLFYVYDLISKLRTEYLTRYQIPQQLTIAKAGNVPLAQVDRRKVVQALPQMLYDHFPNILEQCMDWGFERTCGILYTEVLPAPQPGGPYLDASDIDLISATSIFLEGILNRCDYNHDGKFKTQLIDGFDEKHCVLKLTRALIIRLMNAGVMDPDRKVDLLTRFISNTWVGRQLGRKAISSGSPLKIFLPKAASLGSIINLAAGLMNSEKAKAIERGYIGPHEYPGDEFIYLNQLTDSFKGDLQYLKQVRTQPSDRNDPTEEVLY